MKLTFDNHKKLIIQQAFPRSPLTSEPKQKLLLSIILILFMLIQPCFTRCIQFTDVLEALYFKSEHTETNLSTPHPFFTVLTLMTLVREEREKTNSV